MKKTIEFSGDTGVKHFEFLWQAICLGPLQSGNEKRSMETMRREAKIIGLLEGISNEEAHTIASGDHARKLCGDTSVVLEQADIDMLKKCIEAIPWKPSFTPAMTLCYDWLSSAKDLMAEVA